jgi:hypothetical protein
MLSRRGTSLVELLIALALTALVLGTATSSLLHQQREARWTDALGGAESQMRPFAQVLQSELAPLDAAAGDLVSGAVSDSTIQIRALVASSLACDSAAATVTLLPDATAGVSVGGIARAPVVGDSLWFLVSDSVGWQSRTVVGVAHPSASCRLPPSPPSGTFRLTLDAPVNAAGATPIRITRQERYVVYRASDGWWYLGARAWSAVTNGFAAPQPIAGPFVRLVRGGAITGFRYFDSSGVQVMPNGANERTIARVRLGTLALVPSFAGTDSVRRDSADVALARGAAF